ncbi:MAG: MaoC family dehydratase N-terminal domain-containing protein [Desulfatiglandales bacterium]
MNDSLIDITNLDEHFPVITEEALQALRDRIGKRIESKLEPWVREVTADAIRHYAYGIGDDNPLWTDPDYAARSRYRTLIAPPTVLYATDRVVSGYVGGLPGVHAMFAGSDWHWYHPIKVGTRIRTEVYLKDLIEHKTRFAGRAFQQIYHGDFFDQEGKKLAECDSWCFRTERATAREKGDKYRNLKARKVYSKEEIDKIAELYEKEEIRGDTSRFWEDVEEGMTLPTIIKGPMTVTGFIAFVQGWGGLYIRAHKLAFKQYQKHSGLGISNEYGIPDVPERVHWEDSLARAIGTPGAYDYGPERVSWMGHLMTNWIGDDGWLCRLHARVVRHNPVGDTLWISGRVKKKYRKEDRGYVECALVAKNQEGELSCEADATCILPSNKQH